MSKPDQGSPGGGGPGPGGDGPGSGGADQGRGRPLRDHRDEREQRKDQHRFEHVENATRRRCACGRTRVVEADGLDESARPRCPWCEPEPAPTVTQTLKIVDGPAALVGQTITVEVVPDATQNP